MSFCIYESWDDERRFPLSIKMAVEVINGNDYSEDQRSMRKLIAALISQLHNEKEQIDILNSFDCLTLTDGGEQS